MKTREIGTMTECRFPDKKEAVYATASNQTNRSRK
ncbi:unnamed protein product, partial [marine sediment metagenome]